MEHIANTENTIWQGWKPGEYQVHFIHTGVGEAIFHIFPDGTTMLLDCGDQPALTRLELSVPVVPHPGRLAGDWVARYIKRVLPVQTTVKDGRPVIDYMVLSHFHDDHCGNYHWQTCGPSESEPLPDCYRSGFALAAEQLAFDTAIDRGWPDYTEPYPGNLNPCHEYDHMLRIYKALQKRDGMKVEKFQLGSKTQLCQRHGNKNFPGFEITNITSNGCILCKDGSLKNLYPNGLDPNEYLNENTMSLGMIVRYGKFSLYLGGDFSDAHPGPDSPDMYVENCLADEISPVDVAKINHHGYYSMPNKLVKALRAHAWIAPVWDQLHVLDFVMARMADRNNYPDDRMFFPTVFAKERVDADKDKPFFKDIAPEVMGMGAHVVLTVPKGGENYRITCIDATNEDMKILGEYLFESKG